MITGKNQIGNKKSSLGDISFHSYDPKRNVQSDWLFHQASPEEVDEAVELASKAFAVYSKTSAEERRVFLEEIGDHLLSREKELLEAYCLESGLDKERAKSELHRTVFQLKSYGSYAASDEFNCPTSDVVSGVSLKKVRVPIGPIVVFGSSNFPFAYSTAGGDTASALAAGCPVIVKGHPMHPATGELVANAIIDAATKCKMPDGVFSNLHASNYEVGQQLVLHPKVKGVGFTGSIPGGRALYDLAAKREEPIPVFAEMGSVNPVIFSELELKKNAETWAVKMKDSMLNGTGQFCTNPGLIIGLKSGTLDRFLNLLVDELCKSDPTCMLGTHIHESFDNLRKERMYSKGVLTVFEHQNNEKSNFATATLVKVSGSAFLENKSLHQEVFGPFSIVVECGSIQEMVKVIEGLEGQLTGTINCDEEEKEFAQTIMEVLVPKVGRLIFKGVPTGVTVSEAMHHGGPYPATTDSRFTAVGGHAVYRWVRSVCFQNVPDQWVE